MREQKEVSEPDIEKPQVSALTKRVLESGLIDESMAAMMEQWGTLPEGASQYVNNDALKNVTRQQLAVLTEKLSIEIDKQRSIKETNLDLNRLKWPVSLRVIDPNSTSSLSRRSVTAMRDRIGRYFFRTEDAKSNKIIPGFLLENDETKEREVVAEVSPLYVGEEIAAIQVSVLYAGNSVEE